MLSGLGRGSACSASSSLGVPWTAQTSRSGCQSTRCWHWAVAASNHIILSSHMEVFGTGCSFHRRLLGHKSILAFLEGFCLLSQQWRKEAGSLWITLSIAHYRIRQNPGGKKGFFSKIWLQCTKDKMSVSPCTCNLIMDGRVSVASMHILVPLWRLFPNPHRFLLFGNDSWTSLCFPLLVVFEAVCHKYAAGCT